MAPCHEIAPTSIARRSSPPGKARCAADRRSTSSRQRSCATIASARSALVRARPKALSAARHPAIQRFNGGVFRLAGPPGPTDLPRAREPGYGRDGAFTSGR
jgi:hypothetical protein